MGRLGEASPGHNDSEQSTARRCAAQYLKLKRHMSSSNTQNTVLVYMARRRLQPDNTGTNRPCNGSVQLLNCQLQCPMINLTMHDTFWHVLRLKTEHGTDTTVHKFRLLHC